MEQDQLSSLFEMNMDDTSQGHLLSISKWTRFISVTGLVIGALLLIAFVLGGQKIFEQLSALTVLGQRNIAGGLIAVVVIVFALLGGWIYFLFKASNLIRRGLQKRDSIELAEGFRSMRIYFVFSMIISLLTIFGTIMGMLTN